MFGRRLMPALSSDAGMLVDIAGSEAALYMSYFMGSSTPTAEGSTKSPVSRSTRRTSKRSKVCSICSALAPCSSMPAADRMLVLMSRFWFWICAGRSNTAAVETTTEKTILSTSATIRVLETVSLALATSKPPFDVGLNHVVVHQRRKQVSEQDRQHDAFRERRVARTDQHGHHAHQDAEAPATGVGHGGRHRVRGHKHHAEGKATHHQVPVCRYANHRVGFRTDDVQQQGHTDHADHHTTDDAVGGNLHGQQDQAADQNCDGGGFTHGTLDGADKGVHPANLGFQCFQAARCSPAQGSCATEAVYGSPYGVTGNLCRVREVQEGTAGQCRVQEVLAGTAEHFLTDHHTEGDTQGHLPQRDGGRADQCEQYGGHKEAFVHFVLAHGGEQDFPETTHNKGNRVDGHKVRQAIYEVIPQSGVSSGYCQGSNKGFTQAAVGNLGAGVVRQEAVGLETDVPHTEEHGRESTQPHSDHDALEVDAVTHMGGGLGYARRRVENSIDGFVQGVPALVLSAFFKVMLDSIEKLSDCHRISPRSRFGSGSRGESDRIHICRGTRRCTAPDLLHPAPGHPVSVPFRYRQQSVHAAAGLAGYRGASPAHTHLPAPWPAHCRWWWW